MNAFYPSCEQLVNPALRGKPVMVVMTPESGDKITRGAIASCSYEARKFGVRSGMSFNKAKELCPEAVFIKTNFELYEKVSAQVMDVLETFADVLEPASIDEAYMDSTKKAQDYDSPQEFGSSVKNMVKHKVGLICSVGIAPTKSAAKIASDYVKPDGLTVVTPENIKEFLSPLEVSRVAGIGPKTESELKKLGVTTLGELAQLSPYKLVDKFGKVGLWMWKVASGIDDERVDPRNEYKSISTEHTLDEETSDAEKIKENILPMIPELYARINELGLVYRTVAVKLVYRGFKIATRDHSFKDYRSDYRSMEEAVDRLLRRFDYEKPVRKVGLRLSTLTKADTKQRRIEDWFEQAF
jgi:DNA polymerase IV (DinB-like DNA polymerase)